MHIPIKVERKIRLLCQKIPNTEWSGVLFYNTEGSFEENNLVIICEDILLMDIGNSTNTEFNMSPEVVAYMTEHQELLNSQQGLIHSHSTFSAFFSGTDLDTLYAEGKDRNHFVSLIVNNAGQYVAAITREAKSKKIVTESVFYNTFNNIVKNETNTYEVEEDTVEYFLLDIIKDKEEGIEELEDKIKELKDIKESTKVTTTPFKNTFYNYNNYNKYESYYDPEYKQGTLFSTLPSSKSKKEEVTEECDQNKLKGMFLQLITGSIIVTNENKIDISKWTKNMGKLYDKRFGTDAYGFNTFKVWAETYVDTILSSEEDYSIYAAPLVDMLLDIKENNKYLDYYIELLNFGIPCC